MPRHPRIQLAHGQTFAVVPRSALMSFWDERAAVQLIREALRDPFVAEDLRRLACQRSILFEPFDDETVARNLAEQLVHGELVAVIDGDDLLPWNGKLSLDVRTDPAPVRPHVPVPPATPRTPTSTRDAEAVLSVRLVTDDGVPIADAAIAIHEGATAHDLRTDANGMAMLALPEGPYDVQFVEPPLKLPLAADLAVEPRRDILVERVRSEAFTVSARPPGAEPRVVAVRRPRCTEVLVDGYAQGAKVLRWGGMRARNDGTVGTTRAALRTALWLARGKTLCVAGHADPLGQDADNDALSAERATSLHLFVTGDLDTWAAHASAHADDTDLACALVACHRILGMGAATLADDAALANALQAVRAGAGVAADGPAGPDDWHAFAELYETDLAALLFTDRAGLAEIRGTLTWTDPPTVALSERWPRPDPELADNSGNPALAQRRSSLLIFESRDEPQRAIETSGAEMYDGTYRRTIVPVPGEVMVDIAIDTPKREPIAGGRAWISVGDLGVHEHTAGSDGHVRFMTCRGDRIELVSACDPRGRGTVLEVGRATNDA